MMMFRFSITFHADADTDAALRHAMLMPRFAMITPLFSFFARYAQRR